LGQAIGQIQDIDAVGKPHGLLRLGRAQSKTQRQEPQQTTHAVSEASQPSGGVQAVKSLLPRGQTCYRTPMEWREREERGLTIIHLRGEVDLQHSPQLREILQTKVARRIPTLVLELSEVRYIDSSGLATLVEYYQQSRSFSGRMVLAGATPRVKSVFDLVRLSEVFEFYPTIQEAEAGLRPQ
jgi:anti-sigma B factor antagonist